tara:strand:+ start:510 stop:734 length:225 start_codon:yes stop_codon:yes gene_type:complete
MKITPQKKTASPQLKNLFGPIKIDGFLISITKHNEPAILFRPKGISNISYTYNYFDILIFSKPSLMSSSPLTSK